MTTIPSSYHYLPQLQYHWARHLLGASYVLPGPWLTMTIAQLLPESHTSPTPEKLTLPDSKGLPGPSPHYCNPFPTSTPNSSAYVSLISTEVWCYYLLYLCLALMSLFWTFVLNMETHAVLLAKARAHGPDYVWHIKGFLIYKWFLFPRKVYS